MSPDELFRAATRIEASRPKVTAANRTAPLTVEVVVEIVCGGEMLCAARDLELLLQHTSEIRQALGAPDREARSMERAVRIISEIVNGQKPYNESEIEVEVLRIFGRIE